jgi:hypothetical protein
MYFWIKYFITLEDFYKIAAFILIAIFICACNVRVPDGKQLLTKSNYRKWWATKAENVFNQLYQNQIALYY